MSLGHLPSGSLASQVAENKKEFHGFLKLYNEFVKAVMGRFQAVQDAFATDLNNHELRIRELEARFDIAPPPDLPVEPAEEVTDASGEVIEVEHVEEKPIESKLFYHKDYD